MDGLIFTGTLQELTDYCEHLEKQRRHFASSCQYLHCNWQRLYPFDGNHCL